MNVYESKSADYTKPCRVLICSPSDWIRGGVQNYIYSTILAMNRNDIQVDFYTPRRMPDEVYLEKMHKLGVNMFEGGQAGTRPNYRKVGGDIRKLITLHQYTVIYVNTGSPTFQASSLLAAWKPGKSMRRISHSHNSVAETSLKVSRKIVYELCRFIITKTATDFLACSNLAGNFLFGKKRMLKYGRVINNGIDFNKFKFNIELRNKIRTELNINESTILVGLTAHYTQQKNHEFLIQTFSEFAKLRSNVRLVLLGDDVNGGMIRSKIEALSDELGVKESIYFLGTVTNTNEYYSAMDIFVMPSLWEGLPYAGIEAQAACLPCLFSDGISRELELTEWAHFIPLKDGSKKWAEKANEFIQDNRLEQRLQKTEETRENIRKHGYDLHDSVAYVEKLFLGQER